MYKREKDLIILSKQGNKEALSELLEKNRRINMEYCKKICWKRI